MFYTERNRVKYKIPAAVRDLIIVYIILNSFGFPGRYQAVFGTVLRTVMDYAAFILEICLILFSTGDTVLEIRLIDLKSKYSFIYCTVVTLGVMAMIGTRNHQLEIISVVRITTTAMFGIWLCENFTPRRIAEYFYYAQILFTAASIIFITAFRQYYIRSASYQNDYVGIYGVKNEAASQLSFSIMMQMALLKLVKHDGGKVGDIPLFGAVLATQIILLLSSHGLGGLFFAGIPVLYIFFGDLLFGKNHRLQIGIIYVIGSIAFLIVALNILPLFKPLFDFLGKDVTLTGRTLLWEQIIKVMKRHKTLTGFGYGMFWRDPQAVRLVHAGFEERSFMGRMTSGAHNTVLEAWLNSGLIGIAANFTMIIAAFSHRERIPQDAYIFSSAFFLWYMLHGWMERANGNYEYFMIALYAAAALAYNKEPEKAESRTYIDISSDYLWGKILRREIE